MEEWIPIIVPTELLKGIIISIFFSIPALNLEALNPSSSSRYAKQQYKEICSNMRVNAVGALDTLPALQDLKGTQEADI